MSLVQYLDHLQIKYGMDATDYYYRCEKCVRRDFHSHEDDSYSAFRARGERAIDEAWERFKP